MHIIIVGGGVAGLGAAYKAFRAAQSGLDVTFTLLEKADRLGGKLATDLIPDPETGEMFVVDGGSDSFLTDKPAVHRVARLLGIEAHKTGTMDENKRTFIVKNGRLVELPDGIMMFAPTKIMPMVTTSLYSWPAKLRMALDLVIPRKSKWADGESAQQHDESLESLVVRRMGHETLDRLAEPLVGGVNGSDPAKMSLAATYPMLLDMEQEHGSLVRGFLAQRKKVEAMKAKHSTPPGTPARTFFTSFRDGLQFLTDHMADAVGRDRIRTNVAVTDIARDGDSWRVTLDGGETLAGDAVVLATEVWAAADLARAVDAQLADLLSTIPSTSSATVALAFDDADCPFDRRWHGILSPRIEKRVVTGVSLMSSKWPGRAPADRVLLRAFVGGPHNADVLRTSDEEIIRTVVGELVDLLGVREGAQPVVARVYRWDRGMPQYTVGHLDRVDAIERRLTQVPGLAVAGGGFRGVGVPNCLESGEHAVEALLAQRGMLFEEDDTSKGRS